MYLIIGIEIPNKKHLLWNHSTVQSPNIDFTSNLWLIIEHVASLNSIMSVLRSTELMALATSLLHTNRWTVPTTRHPSTYSLQRSQSIVMIVCFITGSSEDSSSLASEGILCLASNSCCIHIFPKHSIADLLKDTGSFPDIMSCRSADCPSGIENRSSKYIQSLPSYRFPRDIRRYRTC